MDKLINFLSGIMPFWLLKIFLPDKFILYGHLVSNGNHFVSKYYKYPSQRELSEFIDWVTGLGYSFVDLDDYMKIDDRKKILLTFDDGFKVIIDELHPYLRNRKIPYVIFVLTDPFTNKEFFIKTVKQASNDERAFLSVEEVLTLKGQGVHIGFHTRSHPRINKNDEIDEALIDQLTIPPQYKMLFSEPLCFAYPYIAPKDYSRYNAFMKENLGYKYFFDTRGFSINEQDHFFRVGIDAENDNTRKKWMRFLIKKQLVIFILKRFSQLFK
jgi:hypothetical protein